MDAAVVDTAQQVLATGEALTEEFGVDESGGLGVGLLCGGTIEVFVERVEPSRLAMLTRLRDAIRDGVPASLATTLSATPQWHLVSGHLVTAGPKPGRSRSWLGLDLDIDDLLAAGRSGIVGFADCDDRDGKSRRPRTLVQTFAPPRRLILVGANDFVRELAGPGQAVGDAGERRRRPPGVRHSSPISGRRRGGRRLARPLPAPGDRCRTHRRFDGRMRDDPRHQVRRARADRGPAFGGTARLRRRARLAPYSRRPPAPPARSGPVRLRTRDAALACRPGPGRPYPAEAAVSIAAEIIAERTHATGRPLHALTGPIHRTPGPLVQVKRPGAGIWVNGL